MYAIAIGKYAIAIGKYAFTIGKYAIAMGKYAFTLSENMVLYVTEYFTLHTCKPL